MECLIALVLSVRAVAALETYLAKVVRAKEVPDTQAANLVCLAAAEVVTQTTSMAPVALACLVLAVARQEKADQGMPHRLSRWELILLLLEVVGAEVILLLLLGQVVVVAEVLTKRLVGGSPAVGVAVVAEVIMAL